MSTDPLSEAIGRSEPARPAGSASGPQEPPPEPAYEPPAPEPAPPAYEPPAPAYEPPSAPAAPGGEPWSSPDPDRSLLERRPEILVGAALAGGFIAAQLLGRARGR